MSELNTLAHHLDAERKTAIRRCAFCSDIVDVYSPSIWAGWYRGVYTDYQQMSKEEMEKVKHFLHVEWGGIAMPDVMRRLLLLYEKKVKVMAMRL